MAILRVPDKNFELTSFEDIRAYLARFDILHEQWHLEKSISNEASQDEILATYETHLKDFMGRGNYQTADVINVHDKTPNIAELRNKFLKEHTHSEDEIRFFVDGEGLFWFHIGDEVMSLLCQKGDLISVPAGYKHWFDLGSNPFVKAIRIFTNPEGWVAQFTNSGIDSRYNPKY